MIKTLSMEKKNQTSLALIKFILTNVKFYKILISIVLCIFHIYTGLFGLLPSLQQRAIHVGLVLILVFLYYPFSPKTKKYFFKRKLLINIVDSLLIILTIVFSLYIYFNYKRYLPFMVEQAGFFELFLAIISTIIIIEASRRTIGLTFTFFTIIMLVYALFGNFIPGYFGHPPIGWNLIFENIYLSANGIWGFLTGLSSTYIALFIIFGSFLVTSGSGQTFTDLALLITGKYQGGPAKVAVFASGSFAMISGSAVANVASTGNFTIPMMKKLGYPPDFAAGVEAVASTGGALTPPVMGSAAFVMAELLNIPYLTVLKAAIIPAILFYISVYSGVHISAIKYDLKPIPKKELPQLNDILSYKKLLIFSLPLASLLYLLFSGYSLNMVAGVACFLLLFIYIVLNSTINFSYKNLKNVFFTLVKFLEEGGKSLISIVPLLICANIVLCLINFTGLGVKISTVIMSYGASNIFLSLLLTALLVLILGTGLPLVAAYILAIVIAGPMLKNLGFTPIASHMFCLYYSVIANLTPPLCPAVFMASAIAKSNWLKTAWISIKLAPILYIVPFIFIFSNSFLMIGNTKLILINLLTAIFGTILMNIGTMGYLFSHLNTLERLIFLVSGASLLLPSFITNYVGTILFFIGLSYQIYKKFNKLKNIK